MNHLEVSVIIPVHNRTEELKRAISSALAQTQPPREILVMDDASTEDLASVCAAFNSSVVRHIRSNKKTNANVMRNQGLLNATGSIIALLDSDDEFLPDHLEKKVADLIASGSQGLFGGAFIDDGNTRTYAPSRPFMPGQSPSEYLLTNGFAPTPTWLMLRENALQIMFDESLHRHQDYDFFIRFAEKFQWHIAWSPTVVIHWGSMLTRQRDPGSEIQFIVKNFSHISPKVYAAYHVLHLCSYLDNNAPQQIIQHFRRECFRYVMQLSFIDFCTIHPKRKGISGFAMNWIHFSFLILMRKFSTPAPPSQLA